MDAGTGILPSVRNATGGVFHAERAWADGATSVTPASVKIGGLSGVEMVDQGDSTSPSSTPTYYKNGGKQASTNVITDYNAKYEPGTNGTLGTLTLRGLSLINAFEGIYVTGSGTLTIVLDEAETSEIKTNTQAVFVMAGLHITGSGTLIASSERKSSATIYASNGITIDGGATVHATKETYDPDFIPNDLPAQAITTATDSITISGEHTSVKAVNEGEGATSYALFCGEIYNSKPEIRGAVTVSDGATLEVQAADTQAVCATRLDFGADQDYIVRTGDTLDGTTQITGSTASISQAELVNTKAIKVLGPNYLTFTAEVDNSSVTLNYESGKDVQYKKYTKTSNTWGKWTTYTKGNEITLAKGDKVSFKGENVKTWTDSNGTPKHFTMTGKIAASGSVTSLTDGVGNDPNVTLQEMCYAYMFEGCTALTAAPELPATNLTDWCYSYMFYNCTSLKTAPTLPAEALANNCYYAMFGECTSLTAAPELPATKIPESAYALMFYKCTSLTAAPELSATEIGALGYYEMFAGCTSLTAAPKLPATTIDASSYYEMFAGCINLTTPPPTLPAQKLTNGCYKAMFSGCMSLKTVPTISATSLATECCSEMFSGCTNLSIQKDPGDNLNAWSINATESTTAKDWNKDMFTGCTNVDFGSGSKTPQLNTTYYVNPAGANSGGTTPTGTKITKPTLAENTFSYQGKTITPTLQFTNKEDAQHVTISGDTSKKNVGNYTIRVTPKNEYTWADNSRATLSFSWSITQAGKIYVNVENLTAYVDDTTLPQHKYTITGLLGEDQGKAKLTFTYRRYKENGKEENTSKPDLTKEGKYLVLVSDVTIGNESFKKNYKGYICDPGELKIVKKDPIPSGSSGGGYVAPSTDVKTSGSADSKVTSSPSTVQNETRTDASGKQETVAKVTVSAANQREILSQAKANKSKRIIIQIAKTAVQGDAKLELNLDKTFVQSILHDTEASLTIRTADGDKMISREALKTLVAQTEGNTVVIDPAAQENPTDPAEPSKTETLAALDSSRLVARSKLVTLKNGRKGIRITWSDKNGAEMNFDGVEIYRSTKKNRFGKKPFYATKGGKSAGYYINSKSLKSGVTYYYKVRGYVLIDGQKHYTDLSLKAIRTVK